MSSPPRLAVLSPYTAMWIVARLREAGVGSAGVRAQAQALRGIHGAAPLADDLEASWAQLLAAAADHVERHGSPRAVSGSGSAETEAATSEAECTQAPTTEAGEMTAKEAAEVLGVTSRRVGQMADAGLIEGRKVAGRWLLSASAVEAAAEVRSAS